jgi:ornithine cyclodeaminase/alanine dehydrogenase-like protein (mu-crystallin family)
VNGIRIVAAEELRAHVQFEDLIEPVSRAFQASSTGRAENGLIVMFPCDTRARGDVYVKTGTLAGSHVYIVKVSPWFAVNVERGDPQGGFIGVFDSLTGRTLALLDEQHYLSDIRTAAAGSLAARVLAPLRVRTAAVLGAGEQAYWQPQALYRERPFEVLLIWARDPEKAVRLKERLTQVLPKVDFRVIREIEEVVRRCDVLITATLSREPIVRGEWLRAGQHITAVGADDSTKCELDVAALRQARVFVDCLDSNASSGDVGRAIASGRYALEEVSGELGEVLGGSTPGRATDLDITIAKLVGIGAQDLVAAEVSLQRLGLL